MIDEILEGMRKCPFCAEIIRNEAKICRFCQRDLPVEPSEDNSAVAGSDLVAAPEWRYGDRVSSPIMGDGMVLGTDGDSVVLVAFDRDPITQRKVAVSELLRVKAAPRTREMPTSGPYDSLIVAAWVTTFLLPLIGFICGVILVAKGRVGHGVGSMITSLMMCFVWVAMFTALAG